MAIVLKRPRQGEKGYLIGFLRLFLTIAQNKECRGWKGLEEGPKDGREGGVGAPRLCLL